MSSIIRQVHETLKLESRKGDFVYLIKQDMEDLDLDLTGEDLHKNTVEKIHSLKSKRFCSLLINRRKQTQIENKTYKV